MYKKKGNKGGGRGSRLKNRIVDLQDYESQQDSPEISAREKRKIAALWKRIKQQEDRPSDEELVGRLPQPKIIPSEEESDEYKFSEGSDSNGEEEKPVVRKGKKRGPKPGRKRGPKPGKKRGPKPKKRGPKTGKKRGPYKKRKKKPETSSTRGRKKKVGRKRKRKVISSSDEPEEDYLLSRKNEDEDDNEESSEEDVYHESLRGPPRKRRKYGSSESSMRSKLRMTRKKRGKFGIDSDELSLDEEEDINDGGMNMRTMSSLPPIPKKRLLSPKSPSSAYGDGGFGGGMRKENLKQRMEREKVFRMNREHLFQYFVGSLGEINDVD